MVFGISRQKETQIGAARLGPGHTESGLCCQGNRSLKIPTGAETKLVKSGQALWPLFCATFSQLGSGEECENQRNSMQS